MSAKRNVVNKAGQRFYEACRFQHGRDDGGRAGRPDMSFERIKIPSAGSTVFEVPGENPGEPDTVKEFSAVILYHHPLYAYYKTKYTGGNQPPDCGSFDGITGEGDPGGIAAPAR